MPVLITLAHIDKCPTKHASHIKKCLAGCKLSANIRERCHLQVLAVAEVERLQRRQLADRLGQRLQPSLMNPKILSRTSIEAPLPKKKENRKPACRQYSLLLIRARAIDTGAGYQ